MPGHIANQIAIAVENALAYREIGTLKNTLASEKPYLEEEIKSELKFAEIVGQSAALKKILRQVQTVAPTDSAVLLFGETATGKELIARFIHDLSGRRERTLVKLNCAAIPTGCLKAAKPQCTSMVSAGEPCAPLVLTENGWKQQLN